MIREETKHTVVETTTRLKLSHADILAYLKSQGHNDWVAEPKIGVWTENGELMEIDDFPLEISYVSKKEYKS